MQQTQRTADTKRWLLLLTLWAAILAVVWVAVRLELTNVVVGADVFRFVDVVFLFVVGTIAILFFSRILSRYISCYIGASQGNTVRLLFQVATFALLLLVAFSLAGGNVGNALLGAGFIGIVLGLAAQAVLGNFFAGLMIISSKPFGIDDRIALINWQYGKFPPSLAHGWQEPAYTGQVKEITLIYTKIMTDSNMLITVPNGVAMQCLILNHHHDRNQSHIAAQLDVPINIKPEDLQKRLNAELSSMAGFSGTEENFEILEVSSTSYLVALLYSIAPKKEREMKTLLFKAYRIALLGLAKESDFLGRKEQVLSSTSPK
jgi:small-conductance mechanosensitive channel